MKTFNRYFLAVLILTLARYSMAAHKPAFMNLTAAPDLMAGTPCPPPLVGTVRDSSLECHYDYTGDPKGTGISGTLTPNIPRVPQPNTFYPPTLNCTVSCTTPGRLLPDQVICLANPAWRYLQGCPDTSDLTQQVAAGPYVGNEFTDATQQCRDEITDLDRFCRDHQPAAVGSPVGTNGNAQTPSKCCEETGGQPTPSQTPSATETPIESPTATATPSVSSTPTPTPSASWTPSPESYGSTPTPSQTPSSPTFYTTPTSTPGY